MSVFRAVDEKMDILKIIYDTVGDDIIKVSEVEQDYENSFDATGKLIWDRYTIVRGTISWISDRETSWGSIYVGLADSDAEVDEQAQVKLEIPSHIKIDWGEGTEVIVFGKVDRLSAKQDDGTWKKRAGDVFVKVRGLYPIPNMVVPKSEDVEEVEEEIDGWFC
jgi:hypothetical protein